METPFYSVRMRASSGGKHIAGAERMVEQDEVGAVTFALTTRAMSAASGVADEIHCSVERIDPKTINYGKLPDLFTNEVSGFEEGRQRAAQLLNQAGVDLAIAKRAIQLLADGPGPNGAVMSGAVLLNMKTGERLEADQRRGVRVTRMDLSAACRTQSEQQLLAHGLGHRRVLEALTLAGKVLAAPGVVAELCWSDDPDYTTGYVAGPAIGYRRITTMKQRGDSKGGRVFMVDTEAVNLAGLVMYLEKQPVLFNEPGRIIRHDTGVITDG